MKTIYQLGQLCPGRTAAQRWAMVGVTEMIGVDDFGAAETFTVADATTVLNWANQQGIAALSFWALQRDNGGCPGGAAADNCSGIQQSTWQFSHIFAPFTSGTTTPPSTPNTSPSASTSPSTPPGGGLVNGGFETGTVAPWTCSSGSVVTTPVHSGTKALKAAASNSDTAQCSQTVGVSANRTYTLSAWVQGQLRVPRRDHRRR